MRFVLETKSSDLHTTSAADALRRLAAIVESSDDAILSKDLNGIIMSWNRGAEKLFGYTAEEIVGKSVLLLIPANRTAEEPEILSKIRRGEKIDHYETVRQRKNGSLVDISLTVSPILDDGGVPIGASKIARDISERTRAEAALREQRDLLAKMDQRKNEFLAMLGHELRNPLAALQNASKVLDEVHEESATQWAKEVVSRQTALLSRLVDDLVDVARITRGTIEMRREDVDLGTIIRRSVETVRPLFREREHVLELQLGSGPLGIRADAARIEQLLVNLLTNAAKYTDPGGHIQILCTRSGPEFSVVVRDDGIGISSELLPHIFELFVQEPRGLDRSRGGLGLGLALASNLAAMHGGSLSVKSAGPGLGSEFTLRLPSLENSFEAPSNGSIFPASTNHKATAERVLVVDDNHDGAIGLRRLLERRGFRGEIAHDGPSALEIARRFQPDAFLLDLGLPGMDGYALARNLRSSGFSDALYIAISGYAQPKDVEESRREGFYEHLAKPVDIEAVSDLIRTGCAGKAP